MDQKKLERAFLRRLLALHHLSDTCGHMMWPRVVRREKAPQIPAELLFWIISPRLLRPSKNRPNIRLFVLCSMLYYRPKLVVRSWGTRDHVPPSSQVRWAQKHMTHVCNTCRRMQRSGQVVLTTVIVRRGKLTNPSVTSPTNQLRGDVYQISCSIKSIL